MTGEPVQKPPAWLGAAVNRLREALSSVLDAARRNWHSRWERPVPRHTAKPAQPASEPEPEPEPECPSPVSPAFQTRLDMPPFRVPPYADPDEPDGPKHRRPR